MTFNKTYLLRPTFLGNDGAETRREQRELGARLSNDTVVPSVSGGAAARVGDGRPARGAAGRRARPAAPDAGAGGRWTRAPASRSVRVRTATYRP